jgi:hypothetical protein
MRSMVEGAQCGGRAHRQSRLFLQVPASRGRNLAARPRHIPHRSAAVCTGASHSPAISSSISETVIEQPAMSSEVT